jgi:hypothetical protein
MSGNLGLTGQSPSAACKSVWHTPDAITCTRIWFSFGAFTGISSILSGWPNSVTTAAFMVFGNMVIYLNEYFLTLTHQSN